MELYHFLFFFSFRTATTIFMSQLWGVEGGETHFNQPLSPNLGSVIYKELGWPSSSVQESFSIAAEDHKK